MKKLLFLFSAAFLLMTFQSINAQVLHWAKKMGGSNEAKGYSLALDVSHNVYITGTFRGTADFDPGAGVYNLTAAGQVEDIFISKLDAEGNFIWAKQIGSGNYDYGLSIAVDIFGNAYITGSFTGTVDFDPGLGVFNLTTAVPYSDIFILKLDASGNFVWAKEFDDYSSGSGNSIMLDSAGNMYVIGNFFSGVDFDPGLGVFNLVSAGSSDVFLLKLNPSGNFIWAKRWGGTGQDLGGSVTMDVSGNLYTTGTFSFTTDFDPGADTFNLTTAGGSDIFINKLDSSGNFILATRMGGSDDDRGFSIAADANGNMYTTGYFKATADFDPGPDTFNLTALIFSDVFISKLDASGNFRWACRFGNGNYDIGTSIALDDSANVYTTGYYYGTADFDPGPGVFNLTSYGNSNIFISILDSSGNFVCAKQFGGINCYGQSVVVDYVGNIYLTGSFGGTADFDPGPGIINLTASAINDIVVFKLAQFTPYIVRGNVFADVNANCIRDGSDVAFWGMLVKAEPGPFYELSDSTGNYTVYLVDSGSYTISLATQDTLFQLPCGASHNVQFGTPPDTVNGIDFALQAAFFCSRLKVDIITPDLTRCFNSLYTIEYSNTGTFPASNAYIEIDFGSYIQPQSSTLPWSSFSGNVFSFPIGNLNINQQGSFTVLTHVDCNARVGSNQCVTAHIYPDTICIPAPTGWDKSETKVTGACVNDSLVCFTIKNRSGAGTGDMNGAAQWRLYVNDTLVTQGTYQLAGQDSLIKCYPANGKTYRLEADQNPPHPGNSHPKAIVEACGSPASFGFVNTVVQDDADLFIETFCMEVRDRGRSHDPNDKQVSPMGITSNRYITSEDELEYLIRFQNTGTDTAFKVIIIDTILTDVLDIATLANGISSHPSTFNIHGHGIAEWTFDNILLPDSNVNEPESHGFVKFKIQQLPGNVDGTRIENRTAIYFDFNVPVITNTAWNVVNEAAMPESFLTASINSVTDVTCYGYTNGAASVSASGGLAPYQYLWSNSTTTATATGLAAGNYSVTITDATGTALTNSVSIMDPPLLSATIDSITHVLCYANGTGSATASVTGGTPPYSYEWSNHGSAFATATSLNAGIYWVTVWDANLCSVTTSSITITEPPQLTASISTQSAVTCFGGNDAAVKVITGGGIPPHSFNWSNGQTSSTANDLSAGNYLLTVTDSNGCWLITSVTIQNGYQINTGNITGADSADISQPETYSVNAGFSYTWNVTNGIILSGQNTNSIEVDWNAAGQGIIEVVVSDSGCTQTVSKIITVVDPTGIQQAGLNDIQLFPNPTNGTLSLAATINGQATLKLLDAVGRIVWQKTVQQQELRDGVTIDLKKMKEGIFFLNIQSKKGSWVMKVIKY